MRLIEVQLKDGTKLHINPANLAYITESSGDAMLVMSNGDRYSIPPTSVLALRKAFEDATGRSN
jgi:hypothetical protein